MLKANKKGLTMNFPGFTADVSLPVSARRYHAAGKTALNRASVQPAMLSIADPDTVFDPNTDPPLHARGSFSCAKQVCTRYHTDIFGHRECLSWRWELTWC